MELYSSSCFKVLSKPKGGTGETTLTDSYIMSDMAVNSHFRQAASFPFLLGFVPPSVMSRRDSEPPAFFSLNE